MVYGPEHLDHALDLTLAVERHIAFSIHELEGIALQNRHQFLRGRCRINRHLRVGFVHHRQCPGVIAMGMCHHNGIEALSGQLIEIG